MLLDSLLFKIVTTPEKETALLAIPEVCINKITTLYHSSLFAGHRGVIKTYLTINDKLFIPNLIHYLCFYVKGCHICQLACNENPSTRQLQTRINLNYQPPSRLSMDLKVMPRTYKSHKLISHVINEVTNYLITVPIHQFKSKEIGNALIEHYNKVLHTRIHHNGSRQCIYVFTYELSIQEIDIEIKTVTAYNHQSLQAEYGIKCLSTILGQMWPKYLPLATFAYNTFNTPNIANYSPYELVFVRKPKLLLNLETVPDIKVSGTFKDDYNLLNIRLQYLHKLLQDLKSKRLAMIDKDITFFQYNSGDLIYIISPLTNQLLTASRKVRITYVGPVVIYKI